MIGLTAGSSWTDEPPQAPIEFYSVVEAFRYPKFSEYVEGSSLNKALEILNPSDASLDSSNCEIRIYANGSQTPQAPVPLLGVSVPAGDVWVVCNPSATIPPSLCDQTDSGINFNGDDTIALFCGGVLQDIIGQIGFDPGTAWTNGSLSTQDQTLRRKCSLPLSDTTAIVAFDPSVEWIGFALDTFSGLGDPACAP